MALLEGQIGDAPFKSIPGFKVGHPAYLNWDTEFDRKKIKNREWPASKGTPLLFCSRRGYYAGLLNVFGAHTTLQKLYPFEQPGRRVMVYTASELLSTEVPIAHLSKMRRG